MPTGADGIVVDLSPLINPLGGAAAGKAYFFSDGNSVPDGGLTVALLGFALAGIESLRRKMRK